MQQDLWTYSPALTGTGQSFDVVGYHVEATDGRIGSIDDATYEVGESYLIVDTGPWIFGKKVLLPASTVTQVDPQEKKVFVARTKQEIKDAPEFDEAGYKETAYRDKVGEYYGRFPFGPGTI
ncbi:PRC-barrel domain-containing protein [Sphaerisporangium sp. TRM90804]|uniref:PRC-barrel domain-containing protein n=1 Tax=Sphaerisporangium sp. TRM90804 TaxID=3031113 RepID=UPI002448C532|nr:PRC-barrel domain-containing protein [Sphaerisporangium sp. TRM90804]MDH2427504.1 PRC-barrel domain-containing protein [Sphaerisporangium sp. TRM90804]